MNIDVLRIATEQYFWKPNQSFFSALEVEQFVRSGVRLPGPLLDLGSGDGSFASVLRSVGVLDRVDLSLDLSLAALRQARTVSGDNVVQGDATVLPIKAGAFASVLANSMIASVAVHGERAVDQALTEIHRTLAVGGILVFATPTRRFFDNLLIPRIWRSLGLPVCADLYVKRLETRLTSYLMWSEDECRAALEKSGFHVELINPFFTPRQGRWWDVLKLHVFRVFGILKFIDWDVLRRFSSRLQERLFKTVIIDSAGSASRDEREQAGYLLVVARKVVTGQGMHSRTH